MVGGGGGVRSGGWLSARRGERERGDRFDACKYLIRNQIYIKEK